MNIYTSINSIENSYLSTAKISSIYVKLGWAQSMVEGHVIHFMANIFGFQRVPIKDIIF